MITRQTRTSVLVWATSARGAAARSVRALGGLVEVAGMGVGKRLGPLHHAMEDGRLGPMSGEQIEAQDVVEGGDAIAPGDLLPGGVVAAVVGDGDLVDPAPLP